MDPPATSTLTSRNPTSSPWNDPEMAFFVPNTFIENAWLYSQSIQGKLDLLKVFDASPIKNSLFNTLYHIPQHPNTGCMHDDHSLRAMWSLGSSDTTPTINV